jgi:uncharacterized Zn finger protein (UPF0148 family)
MSDLTPPDPHAPAANDVSQQSLKPFLEAMKEGIPHCSECKKPLYVKKGTAVVHHECPVTLKEGE